MQKHVNGQQVNKCRKHVINANLRLDLVRTVGSSLLNVSLKNDKKLDFVLRVKDTPDLHLKCRLTSLYQQIQGFSDLRCSIISGKRGF